MSTKRFAIAIAPALTAAVALFASNAFGAGSGHAISYVAQNEGTEFLTSSGASQTFPGHLATGDRIVTRDSVLSGNRPVGYDNELCTVTFDDNDLCQIVIVIAGKGHIAATWLWVGRNRPQLPAHFDGVIEGGTGTYIHAHGQFEATALPNGQIRITAALQ